MMKRQKYRIANILNCHETFFRNLEAVQKQKQKAEAEALNFRVLMDCLNQENLKLKEAI